MIFHLLTSNTVSWIIIIIFSHLSFSFIIFSYVIVYDHLERSIFTYHHFYHHSLSLSLTNYHPSVSIFHCLSSSTVSPPVTYQHSSYFFAVHMCHISHFFPHSLSTCVTICHYLSSLLFVYHRPSACAISWNQSSFVTESPSITVSSPYQSVIAYDFSQYRQYRWSATNIHQHLSNLSASIIIEDHLSPPAMEPESSSIKYVIYHHLSFFTVIMVGPSLSLPSSWIRMNLWHQVKHHFFGEISWHQHRIGCSNHRKNHHESSPFLWSLWSYPSRLVGECRYLDVSNLLAENHWCHFFQSPMDQRRLKTVGVVTWEPNMRFRWFSK